MTDDNTLPKQDLLLKILNMTTADNDNQALVAIRKANALLRDNGWTWEKLLCGKITIVEDPFKSMTADSPFAAMMAKAKAAPTPADNGFGYARPPRKPYTPPNPPPRPAAAPLYTAASLGLHTVGGKGNNYANHCYMCGLHVDVQMGYIFRPSDINPHAPNRWSVVCVTCNAKTNDTIGISAAKRVMQSAGGPKSANLGQL